VLFSRIDFGDMEVIMIPVILLNIHYNDDSNNSNDDR
jgi:hypothetical protein